MTINNHSGGWFGVHQKIDRVARRALATHTQLKNFPEIKGIIHFEGRNGPDGVKTKSPAQDEPWHYYDPFDPEDTELISLIAHHYKDLVEALQSRDKTKAAFDAAWLSHTLVDGLTPAHHYPYERELESLRGEGKETRTTIKQKLLIKGETKTETLKKNWKMYGSKGLLSTHALFEVGVAATLAPDKIKKGNPTSDELAEAEKIGLEEYFMRAAREVALLDMYEQFYRRGWTARLARQTRNILAPSIVKTIVTAWYLALKQAGMTGKPKAKRT